MNYEPILSNFNITALNPMQLETLDTFGKGNDVMLISPTGSGKTLAFLLPLLPLLDSNLDNTVQVLIIVPARELALQIEQVFKQMGTGFKINCCYGGHAVKIEKNNLQQAPTILVGTPGRLAYHIRNGNVNVSDTKVLILDEFDKSLEAGFQDEMSFIIGHARKVGHRILTSATALDNVPSFVKLNKAIELNYTEGKQQPLTSLTLKSVRVVGDDKLEALMLLIGKLSGQSTIVFCNHREAVNRISDSLNRHSIAHGVYHGGFEQIDREKNLIKLRNGTTQLLITTDLAARGLDIPEIEVVVHYQLPATEDVMIHRNGRTARMNATGEAWFLLDENDYLPKFLKEIPEEETLPDTFVKPKAPEWQTLYFSAGKKDKINKMDIVGMLLQKGQLKKEELGKIEVLDHSAYAAVSSRKIKQVLNLVADEKIKGKRVKMEIAS